ncbi:MAG: single-stranded DNA-binding protein [Lentimicrobiaceae bacterium]
MNNLRNRVMLIGRLGKEPEVRTLENNKKVVRMSLATDDGYIDKEGQKVKSTEWHNLVVWGNGLCDICEKYLTKGKEIAVEGKITYHNWDDKDGKTHYDTEINVSNLLFIGAKGN